MFHMYDKKIISVTSHALDPLPLSQTVTPSRTPSPLERDVLYGRPPSRSYGGRRDRILFLSMLRQCAISI